MWLPRTVPRSVSRHCFSALTLGFFDVAFQTNMIFGAPSGFSALTLGFFDVAVPFPSAWVEI